MQAEAILFSDSTSKEAPLGSWEPSILAMTFSIGECSISFAIAFDAVIDSTGEADYSV